MRETGRPKGGRSVQEGGEQMQKPAGPGAGLARQKVPPAGPAGPARARTTDSGPPPRWPVPGLASRPPPLAACPERCTPPSTSHRLDLGLRRGHARPWAPRRPAVSRPAATRPASVEDGGSAACVLSVQARGAAQCLCSPWPCSCFMAGWAMVRAGALTSMFWRLPSLPSTTRVTGTVSPSLT